VVFDVIGLEAFVSIVNVHVIVSDKEVAALLLRTARPDLDIAGLDGVQAGLLRERNRQHRPEEKIKERREEQKESERGRNPGMEVTIHAEHLCDEISWIA
jgi:hypothetical protein